MPTDAVPVSTAENLTPYRRMINAAHVTRPGFPERSRAAEPVTPASGMDGHLTKLEMTNPLLRCCQRDLAKFEGFAWDQHADALLSRDLTSLSGAQWAVLEGLALCIELNDHEHATAPNDRTKARRFAFGLIADRMGGRLSKRFFRRALQGAAN